MKKLPGYNHPLATSRLFAPLREILSIVILLTLLSCHSKPTPTPAPKEITYPKQNYQPGDLLPQHLVKDTNGNSIPLFVENKTNLIIFWASWCPPCRAEMPALKNIYAEIANNDSIHMLSLSLDDDLDEWQDALKEFKPAWSQAIAEGEIDMLEAKYGFPGIPYIIIANGERKLVKGILGFDRQNEEVVREWLKR